MKQFNYTLLIICLFFLSCNSSANSSSIFSNSTDETFLGTWVFSNAVPVSASKDGSMGGSTCKITKVDGSKESYSVDVLSYQGILFSKKNDSTLMAVDGSFEIKYTDTNQHMIFLISPGNGIEYSKLK